MSSIGEVATLRSLAEWEKVVTRRDAPQSSDIFNLGTDTLRVATGRHLAKTVPTKVALLVGSHKLVLAYYPWNKKRGSTLTVEARHVTSAHNEFRGAVSLHRPNINTRDQVNFSLGVFDSQNPLLFEDPNYTTAFLPLKELADEHKRALMRSIWRGMLVASYDVDCPLYPSTHPS
jgi:hypothetical protein